MTGHGSAMCTLFSVPTTHTYIHTHVHAQVTEVTADCDDTRSTEYLIHTTTALLSLIFSCMAALPTKHFNLPPLKLHITFHIKRRQPLSHTFTTKIIPENISVCDWLEMWSGRVTAWTLSLTFILLEFYSTLHRGWFSDVEGKKK